jgi:stage II sporulation protein D
MSFAVLRTWTTAGFGGLLLLGAVLTASAQPTPDSLDEVRVRLHHQAEIKRVKLTVKDGPLAVHLPSGGTPVMRLQTGETLVAGMRQQDVYVRRGGSGLYATKLRLQPAGTDATWALSFEEHEDRTYTGGLYLAPAAEMESSLLLVNAVPLEDYVASVVAGEYGLDDTEGTRAMAVVARTYGLFASAKFGGAYDQADGTASQVYAGVESVTDRSRSAAQATQGEVLTYDGNLIQSVYFSSSGGHTADNEDVWKADEALPYLRGREDPYDEASPHHTWSATVDRSALLQTLTRHQGSLVEGFVIDEKVPHGRVKTVRILQSQGSDPVMKANDFRLLVNRGVDGAPLKSTWFSARRQGDRYVFDGRGFGHGVGLSQWGAHAMAERGKSYREILQFYYTGVDIEEVEGVEFDPVKAPVAKTPSPAEVDTSGRRIGW